MLLIVPLHKKIDWKHPPVITLLLIVVNVMVFLMFQRDDDHDSQVAVSYYINSGLGRLEYKPALDYVEQHGDYQLYRYMSEVGKDGTPQWVMALQVDKQYMQALHNDQIVTSAMPIYQEWKSKRQKFDHLLNSVTSVRYGLKPGAPTFTTLITSMFLHGGYMHLFGNMIFLLALGLLVEITMDWKTYLSSYMLAGIGGSLLYIVLKNNSLEYGVGASGAIAGLMGAYAVLYGFTKVRFFYYIAVYFDYVKLPAIILFPLWLGDQLLTMQLEPESHVNFLVHIGGICSGALIGLAIKKYSSAYNVERIEEDERKEKLDREMESVRHLMADFHHDKALQILRRIRSAMPDNREVLCRSYECSRINPASDEYHKLAHAIFSLAEYDITTNTLVRETFNEYVKFARPTTRMTVSLICHLAKRFIRQKDVPEAERLVRIILAKKVACPSSQQILQGFVRLLEEQGRDADKLRYMKLIPAKDAV